MAEAAEAGGMRRHDGGDMMKDAEAGGMAWHGGGMAQHVREGQ